MVVRNNQKRPSAQTLAQVLSAYQEQVLEDSFLYPTNLAFRENPDSYRDVLSFLASKGRSHHNYRHYATRQRIEDILSGSALYLTDGSNWNDKYDQERFNPQYMGVKRFGVCFSASSSESIAMWMLYGGIDGNGSMINFDRGTLLEAMEQKSYECGHFNNNRFERVEILPAEKLNLSLVDVLYFNNEEDGAVMIGRASYRGGRYELKRNVFNGIEQVAKHRSWSYENEVRLVATISKQDLEGRASYITCIKIPLNINEEFIKNRVFDSPISNGRGNHRDSELCGTVNWDLCAKCNRKQI